MRLRHPFLFRIFSLILVSCVMANANGASPNFLLIIADDCTFRDIGCYGGQAATPHLDRLAGEGIRLTHCFQAAPMCSPTRHNLYTGLYPVKSGAYPNHTFAKDGTKSVAHYLKALGYRVALSGKKHIGPKNVFPFEYSGKNNPDFAAIDALLADCKETDTPFCLFACSNEPHSPWNKGDSSRYDPTRIKLPPYFVDTGETRTNMANYLAEITYFDDQVGKCMHLLDKHGLRDTTLVIVLSEQGSGFPFGKWTCYDTGLQSACIARWPGKTEAGSVSHAMVEYIDILPTFIEAAGGKPETVLQGKSLVPVLTGQAKEHKRYVFGEMTTRGIINGSKHFGIRSVRSRRFKFIVNFTPDTPFKNACTKNAIFKSWQAKAEAGDEDAVEKVRRYQHRPGIELYDVEADPYEWNNLAGNSNYATIEVELGRELRRWMKEQGDRGQETELAALQHQARNRNKASSKTTPRKKKTKK